MNKFIDISSFISRCITKRAGSLFHDDILDHADTLDQRIHGKSVLVIGGAGTIGSSFIKALLPFSPGSLTVVDYSENGLTELTRDLRSSSSIEVPAEYITYPFDFGSHLFEKLMNSRNFDIIACFAAHKHVRSEKNHLAIEAMIRNNVFNTQKLLKLALLNPPDHFFSVSTDKAANPVNVMGASKMIMEKVLLAYSEKINISTARFANVAFSNGSLLYGFNERIMKRQPISAPLDIKRYFVSPEESGQLCLLACMMGDGGNIFFPKLREEQMMTFSSIAEKYLEELGLSSDYCQTAEEAKVKAKNWTRDASSYPVYFSKSNTSGEKPYEEFYTDTDVVNLERFNSLGIIESKSRTSIKSVKEELDRINDLFTSSDINKSDIVKLLGSLISNFEHIETGKSLDSKM